LISALIFDFDGTIADTYSIIFSCFKQIFREFKGQEVTEQSIFSMFGPAEPELITISFPEYTDVSPIIDRYYELYDQKHDLMVPQQPEISEMLTEFKIEGLRLGLVTGKSRRSLNISLRHLFPENLFDFSIAGDEILRPKPHPEGLQKTLQGLDCSPGEALFIGDTDADFLAGKALAMRTIGVRWFLSNGEFPWREIPDYTFTDLPAFKDALYALTKLSLRANSKR